MATLVVNRRRIDRTRDYSIPAAPPLPDPDALRPILGVDAGGRVREMGPGAGDAGGGGRSDLAGGTGKDAGTNRVPDPKPTTIKGRTAEWIYRKQGYSHSAAAALGSAVERLGDSAGFEGILGDLRGDE